MSQSLVNILVHVVFSTLDRKPWIGDAWRDDLHSYAGGIIRHCGSTLLAANSVEDHIHLLFLLPKELPISEVVRRIKMGTTHWITEQEHVNHFRWQKGYGAFSVSERLKEEAIRYIEKQREHHRHVTFQDEYRRFLEKAGATFDERYVWD